MSYYLQHRPKWTMPVWLEWATPRVFGQVNSLHPDVCSSSAVSHVTTRSRPLLNGGYSSELRVSCEDAESNCKETDCCLLCYEWHHALKTDLLTITTVIDWQLIGVYVKDTKSSFYLYAATDAHFSLETIKKRCLQKQTALKCYLKKDCRHQLRMHKIPSVISETLNWCNKMLQVAVNYYILFGSAERFAIYLSAMSSLLVYLRTSLILPVKQL